MAVPQKIDVSLTGNIKHGQDHPGLLSWQKFQYKGNHGVFPLLNK